MKISSRWQTFFHALAFVAGFTLVFVLLGVSVAFVGYALNAWMPMIAKIGGVVLILFGLQVVGAFPWLADRLRAAGGDKNALGRGFIAFSDGLSRIMYTEGRVQVRVDRRWGYLASFMMGIFFSAGWIPCIGPVLSAILLLAGDTQTVTQGALLLLAYSIGLGIPFLITGAALATVSPWLRKMNRYMGIVSKITGIFLIFIGVLLLADKLTFIAGRFVALFGMGLASLEVGATSAVTLPIAFIAGLLSFLSPCVLPLIPAYIGYLSGTVVAGDVGAGAEARRPEVVMGANVTAPKIGVEAKILAAINRLAAWVARHWLALFNCAVAVFIGLPFLAPVLMEAGLTGPARAIYLIYAPTCHQLPERSFFLFGPHITPSVADLEASQAIPAGLTILQRLALRFPGAPATGYKVAICERDTAIYGAILLNGLLFGALRPTLRRRGKMPKMPLWLFALFVLPAAVDGFTQLFGLRESTWYLRLITGAIFGTGLVWLAYPFVEEAMNDVVRTSAPQRTSTPQREVANIDPQTGQKTPPGV